MSARKYAVINSYEENPTDLPEGCKVVSFASTYARRSGRQNWLVIKVENAAAADALDIYSFDDLDNPTTQWCSTFKEANSIIDDVSLGSFLGL